MNFSWNTDTKPPVDQMVMVAIAQPEQLTAPGNEPTPVWVGFWDGKTWRSEQADEIKVTGWMNFPIPPFVVGTETVGTPGSFTGPQFRVGPLLVAGVGKFHTVCCGEQILAIRKDREEAQKLAQQLMEVAK